MTSKGTFGRFWALTNIWALMAGGKFLNLPKIALHGICHSKTSKKASKAAKVSFLRYWALLSYLYKMHILIKCLVVALDDVEIKKIFCIAL